MTHVNPFTLLQGMARYMSRQNILALLLITHAFAQIVRPEAGLVGWLAIYSGLQPTTYSMIFLLAGAYLINRRVTPPEMILAISPLILHCGIHWYYILFVATDSALSPALWYTAVCAFGIHRAMMGARGG